MHEVIFLNTTYGRMLTLYVKAVFLTCKAKKQIKGEKRENKKKNPKERKAIKRRNGLKNR